LHLTRKPRDSPFEFVSDIAQSQLTQTYREPGKRQQEWTVVPAIRRDAALASILIGCRLHFEMEGAADSYYLVSASLVCLSNWGSPFPLFRAEWDHRALTAIASQETHAQPHWHVLTALQEASRTRPEVDTAAPRPFSPSSNAQDLESLHLAMGTDWHEHPGNTHQRVIADSASIRNWLEKTAKYSIDQVTYALRRAGAHRPAAKAFQR
jgi:hypothetical protein